MNRAIGVTLGAAIASAPFHPCTTLAQAGGTGGCPFAQVQQLTAGDAHAWDFFGAVVAMHGDRAIVGRQDAGANAGRAYVYRREGDAWILEWTLFPSHSSVGDRFGIAVAIEKDRAIVGQQNDPTGAGSAYVFKRTDNTWAQEAILRASDAATGNAFGRAVAISEDRAVVGDFADDTGAGIDAGSAYVFAPDGPVWIEKAKLTASDGAPGDSFGGSVSLSDDRVIVGSRADDTDAGHNVGSAYVFHWDAFEGAWTQEAKLTASDGAAYDGFGASVSISGDLAAAGASQHDCSWAGPNSGAAYIYRRNGSVWSEEANITPADAEPNVNFGVPAMLSGDIAVFGAPSDDNDAGGPAVGSAYIFRATTGGWINAGKLTAADGLENDRFGLSVALDGDTILVGAPADDTTRPDAGSVYAFRAPPPMLGDADDTGVVDFSDVTSILSHFGDTYPNTGPGDANHDGIVNFPDITEVFRAWGDSCW